MYSSILVIDPLIYLSCRERWRQFHYFPIVVGWSGRRLGGGHTQLLLLYDGWSSSAGIDGRNRRAIHATASHTRTRGRRWLHSEGTTTAHGSRWQSILGGLLPVFLLSTISHTLTARIEGNCCWGTGTGTNTQTNVRHTIYRRQCVCVKIVSVLFLC